MHPSEPKTASVSEEVVSATPTPEVLIEVEYPLGIVAESLMPELEELVKKNPNKLIGCGG